jgi:hypothetical protein
MLVHEVALLDSQTIIIVLIVERYRNVKTLVKSKLNISFIFSRKKHSIY